MYRMYRQCIVDVLRTWPKIHGQYTCDTCVSCRTIRRIHVEYVVTTVLLSIVGGIVMYPVPYTQYNVGYIRDTRDTHVSSRCLRRKYMRYVCIVHDTFVSYTIHLGYILGYTPHSGYIYNTSAIHVSYVLWCIATCTVRITNLTLGSSVSQMYLCAIHVSCMYCDVSSAIRRDTSRYVVLRENGSKFEGKG